MIAPDANLLIYAYQPSTPFYPGARAWLQDILSAREPVGIPVLCLHAFLRFVTNPRIVQKPLALPEAMALADTWLALAHVSILHPGNRHWSILDQLAKGVRLGGAQITDAAIAAIAIEYGATVHSNDRNFARFPGLRWLNPLEA
jgi:toxin-antitoxin system PIN domain toxin